MDQQINHFQPQGGTFQTVRGTFRFDGLATMLQNVPTPADTRVNSWAAFLLGLPSEAGKVSQLVNPNSMYRKTYSAYVQDTWQLTPNVTVGLGLRWELQPFPTRPDGMGVNRFDPSDGFVYSGGSGSTPQDTNAKTHGLFRPRAGVTHRLGDKTVLRSGYSRSGDPTSFVNFRNSYPSVFAFAMQQVVFNGVGNPYIPVTTLRTGAGVAVRRAGYHAGPVVASRGHRYDDVSGRPGARLDSQLQHHRRTRREVLADRVGRVRRHQGHRTDGVRQHQRRGARIGNAGRPLVLQGLTNLTADINSYQPYGDTSYDGLQTNLRARAKNVLGGVAYTWSETTNDTDHGGGNAAGAGGPRIQYLPEKERNTGLAGYDRRTISRRTGCGICRSARTSARRRPDGRERFSAAGRSTACGRR